MEEGGNVSKKRKGKNTIKGATQMSEHSLKLLFYTTFLYV